MKFRRWLAVTFVLVLGGLLLISTMIHAAPNYVTFDWSTKYNNSIRAYLQPANNWTWATSEILSPNPSQLGAWKWSAPYNWTRAYVVTNIEGNYETYKVCTGRTSSDPGDPYQLFNDPRNRCFKVWRTGSSSVDWVEVFNIYGQVKDSNGVAVSGVTISLDTGGSTTTDSNGEYSFVNLDSGSYTIILSKSDYVFSPSSRTVSGGPDYHVTGQDFTGTKIPDAPTLSTISNTDKDGNYTADWSDVSGASSYELEEDDNADFSSPTSVYAGGDSQYTVNGQIGGVWYYRVRASNVAGDSDWSNTESVIVKPAAPTLNPISNLDYDNNYNLIWSASVTVLTYTLEEGTSPNFASPVVRFIGSHTQYSVTDQTKGIWYYRVQTTNAGGTSGWSNVVSTAVGTLFSLAPTSVITNTPYALHVYTLTLMNEAPHADTFHLTYIATDTSKLPVSMPDKAWKYTWVTRVVTAPISVEGQTSVRVPITIEIPANEQAWVTHTLTVTATSQTYGTQQQATLQTSTRARWNGSRWVSCRFDLGGSGRVNWKDVMVVNAHLGSTLVKDMIYDFDHSGTITEEDRLIIFSKLGRWCAP